MGASSRDNKLYRSEKIAAHWANMQHPNRQHQMSVLARKRTLGPAQKWVAGSGELDAACVRLWRNAALRRMSVMGHKQTFALLGVAGLSSWGLKGARNDLNGSPRIRARPRTVERARPARGRSLETTEITRPLRPVDGNGVSLFEDRSTAAFCKSGG